MNRVKKLLLSVFFVVFAVASALGFVACEDKSSETTNGAKLAFNDNLQTNYVIGSLVDLENAVNVPEFQSVKMRAEYEQDGTKKTYLCIGLSFKPTNTGEVTVTVTCGKDKISTKLLVVDPEPSVGTINAPEYELGDVVEISELESIVTVLPLGTPVSVTKVRYAAGEAQELTADSYTFENIGEYEFFYTATNTSGSVEGWFSVNVVREVTAAEENDLTNSIKQMDLSTVTQVNEGHDESDWSWKVTADPYGVYASGANFNYWLSRVYFDFGRIIDLSEEYIEMDVWASENTYEGGVLIYFAPSYPQQFEWHVCPNTVYNQWTTISTADASIRTNEEKTKTGARGIIVTVLHKQIGDYNPEEVYMLFDNLRVCKYPVIGANEQNDATNNGSGGASQGVSFRRYLDKNDQPIDRAAESDWCYKVSTVTESKTSDYPYVDVYFSTSRKNYSLSDYAFSFFVKGNKYYYHEQFYYTVLYFDGNDLAVNGSWQYKCELEEDCWNYVSSIKSGVESGLAAGIRFWLNTNTTDVRDAELYIDNMRLHQKSDAEKYDFSNNITVNGRNDVSYAMTTTETATEASGWAWKLEGSHFDYFKVTFDSAYAFSNYVFSFDLKAVSNFGGKLVAQFVAEDGSVKKDVMFTGDASSWTHFDTTDDDSLLAVYKAVNFYLLADDPTKPVEILLDNVCLTSRGNSEYVAISADDWETTKNADGTTTYKLVSFSGGESYLSLVKDGGYTNEFISVKTKLNGEYNAGIVIGARIPEATMTYNNKAYNKEGFYLVLNNGFFTLYGPTFHGTHCGSFNYKGGLKADTEYELRFGVIYHNDEFKALFYIYNLDGTLHSSYEWTNLGYITPNKLWASGKLAGNFMVWSHYDKERTWTISEPYAFTDAPKLSADGNTVTFKAACADKFLVSTDGGTTWTENTTGIYTLPSYGVYTLQVKAVLGTLESEAAEITALYTEDKIEFAGVSGVSFTKLNHDEGEITYAGYSDGWSASAITLKKAYTTEFIKLGFTAIGTTLGEQELHIGFRQTALSQIILNGYSLWTTKDGGQMALQYQWHTHNDYTSFYSGTSYGERLIDNTSTLVEGAKYYIVAGVVNTGENAQIYAMLLDADDTLIKLYKWSYSAINAGRQAEATPRAALPQLADSGYVTIWNRSTTSRTITYEFVDGTSLLAAYDKPTVSADGNTFKWNAVSWAEGYKYSLDGGASWTETTATSYNVAAYGAYNIQVKAYKEATESAVATGSLIYSSTKIATGKMASISAYSESADGTKSLTFTPDSTVATSGHQSQSTASIAEEVKYGDAFLKVGFTATAACLVENNLNITIRSAYSTVPNPVFSGSYNFFLA